MCRTRPLPGPKAFSPTGHCGPGQKPRAKPLFWKAQAAPGLSQTLPGPWDDTVPQQHRTRGHPTTGHQRVGDARPQWSTRLGKHPRANTGRSREPRHWGQEWAPRASGPLDSESAASTEAGQIQVLAPRLQTQTNRRESGRLPAKQWRKLAIVYTSSFWQVRPTGTQVGLFFVLLTETTVPVPLARAPAEMRVPGPLKTLLRPQVRNPAPGGEARRLSHENTHRKAGEAQRMFRLGTPTAHSESPGRRSARLPRAPAGPSS